jgi:hypothetical protein
MKRGGDPASLLADCLFMLHCYVVLTDVMFFFYQFQILHLFIATCLSYRRYT